MTDPTRRPVLYGDPAHVSVMIDSLARVLEHRPATLGADGEVRLSARHLSKVIRDLLGESGDADLSGIRTARRSTERTAR